MWMLEHKDRMFGHFVCLPKYFSCYEIEGIKHTLNAFNTQKASIGTGGKVVPEVRETDVYFCEFDKHELLYQKMTDVVNFINNQFFRFNLFGIETIQYTVYNDTSKGFYDKHIDSNGSDSLTSIIRKLSVVVMLDSPETYEGGELLFYEGRDPYRPTLEQRAVGSVFAFPSFHMHEVTPVTKGTRRTLVAWIRGPRWI